MKKLLFLLLAVVILPVGCKDNSPSVARAYDVDGEWEIWTAAQHNDCFMLDPGALYYSALFESDADDEDYLFTGSDEGDRCWTRAYVRAGNELSLDEVYAVQVTPDCEVQIERHRVAIFQSDDTFSESSTVEVTYLSGDGCPADALPCDAEFVSVGLRCADCWQACAAAAFVADPELQPAAAPGP